LLTGVEQNLKNDHMIAFGAVSDKFSSFYFQMKATTTTKVSYNHHPVEEIPFRTMK
jgi:hypothetical protein